MPGSPSVGTIRARYLLACSAGALIKLEVENLHSESKKGQAQRLTVVVLVRFAC